MTDTQTNWNPPTSPPPAGGPGSTGPTKKKHKKLWIGLGIFAGLAAIGSAMPKSGSTDTSNTDSTDTSSSDSVTHSTGVQSNNSGNHSAADDVELSTCSSGTYLPSVSVTITNHTSKRSNYLVQIALLDSSGNKVGDGTAASNNVEAGQTATEDALATVSSGSTLARCRIVDVSRYAS